MNLEDAQEAQESLIVTGTTKSPNLQQNQTTPPQGDNRDFASKTPKVVPHKFI